MTSSRAIRRAKERKAKKLEKKMNKKLQQAAMKMPKACDECSKPFDNSNIESFSDWRVAVYDDGPVHLVCSDCVPEDVKNQSR